jgi:hypothetical protein
MAEGLDWRDRPEVEARIRAVRIAKEKRIQAGRSPHLTRAELVRLLGSKCAGDVAKTPAPRPAGHEGA